MDFHPEIQRIEIFPNTVGKTIWHAIFIDHEIKIIPIFIIF